MKEELIILEDDKAYARARIADLEKQIRELGPEFYEVFNQSSETWHDNAPFDALRDRQSLLDAELQQIRQVLRNSLPSTPKQKKGMVGIGSKVTVRDEISGEVTEYLVAGDWTPHAGNKVDGAMVVSCNAPVAQQLIGKKSGDKVTVGRKVFIIQALNNT